MLSLLELPFAILPFISYALAQLCDINNPCPASTPCCSEYGYCGTDDFCLGGCNPMASNSISSCKPSPVCQNANWTFPDTSRILTNASFYDGNATNYDFIMDQGDILHTTDNGGELVLTLSQENGGTRLSSTRYIHYGKITATMKAGRWTGVVAAFITMSDIRDEIDWEFPGDQVTEGQTNFFWQGQRPPQAAGITATGLTDNYQNYHDYTIDWKPDSLAFSIDGTVVQTINQADLVSGGVSHFPNTPSRIELSIWPAGINTSAEGTIQWAGGLINWNDPDYVASGHFFTRFNRITVECYDLIPPANSYVYGKNQTANTPTITRTNSSTILGSAAIPTAVPLRQMGLGWLVVVVTLSAVLLQL